MTGTRRGRGATVVTPGLYFLDAAHDDPTAYAAWLDRVRPALRHLHTTRHPTGASA